MQILGDSGMQINTNPVDIYKSWINQLEMHSGQARQEGEFTWDLEVTGLDGVLTGSLYISKFLSIPLFIGNAVCVQ